MKKQFIFHPILFAFYAFLGLLATNIDQITLTVLTSALKVTLGSILLILLNQLIFKEKLQAGLISTAEILLFFFLWTCSQCGS